MLIVRLFRVLPKSALIPSDPQLQAVSCGLQADFGGLPFDVSRRGERGRIGPADCGEMWLGSEAVLDEEASTPTVRPPTGGTTAHRFAVSISGLPSRPDYLPRTPQIGLHLG